MNDTVENNEKKKLTKETWLFVVALALQVVTIVFVVLWHGVIKSGNWEITQSASNLWHKGADLAAATYIIIAVIGFMLLITIFMRVFKSRRRTFMICILMTMIVLIIYIWVYTRPGVINFLNY